MRQLIFAGLLLVVLTGCTGQTSTLGDAIPAVGGAPKAQPVVVPEVGECRELDSSAMFAPSDNTPASPCADQHDALTYATGDVEDEVPFEDAIKKVCADGFTKALGLTDAQAQLTIFSWAWFEPSPREYAEGARAYRCELVANNTDAGEPVPLPGGAELPLLTSDTVSDDYALCRTDDSKNVACSDPHAWRASGTFEGTGTAYPSDTTFRKWARDRCPDLVTTKNYLYSWPGSGSWADNDDRTVFCFSADKQG